MSTSTGVFAAPAIEDADEATVPEIDHEALALSHARFNPSSRFAKLQRLKEYQQQQSQVAAPVFIRPNEGDDALDGHPIPFQAPVIVDTDVGSKRKRPNDWFELPSHGDDELLVVGVPCMLFRDDQTAARLHTEAHLHAWRGECSRVADDARDSDDAAEAFTLDRYDVRNHIDNMALLVKYKRFSQQHDLYDQDPLLSADDLEVLNVERYCDAFNEARRLRYESIESDTATRSAAAGKQLFHFAYDQSTNDTTEPQADDDSVIQSKAFIALQPAPSPLEISGNDQMPFFTPPFAVPPHIPLPASLAQHDLIVRTAAFVRQSGGRGCSAEILLKASSAHDGQTRQFAFLYPEDPFPQDRTDTIGPVDSLHSYYAWLVEFGAFDDNNSGDIVECAIKAAVAELRKTEKSDNQSTEISAALGALAAYSDDDGDVDQPVKSMSKLTALLSRQTACFAADVGRLLQARSTLDSLEQRVTHALVQCIQSVQTV